MMDPVAGIFFAHFGKKNYYTSADGRRIIFRYLSSSNVSKLVNFSVKFYNKQEFDQSEKPQLVT